MYGTVPYTKKRAADAEKCNTGIAEELSSLCKRYQYRYTKTLLG
jgi:hypothetical protein